MLPINASKVLIVEGIMDDPLTRVRAERLLTGIETDEVLEVDDRGFAEVIRDMPDLHRRNGPTPRFEPLVIFNRFRFDEPEAEQARRIVEFPELAQCKFNGYGGFDWREAGSARDRRLTGKVCQSAWHIHTIVGCPFRCAYCHLSRFHNLMLNMEEYVERLDGYLCRCPGQTLFQWDNITDPVCFEPELDATRPLVEFFASRPGQALELYVGKSDNIDYLLDYDHRGHTVCCWSLAAPTQAEKIELLSAPTSARIEAMRKCRDAGYPVRVRLSPIVPVKGWREENRAMLEELFATVDPDMVTLETIRFIDAEGVGEVFDTTMLDDDMLAALEQTRDLDVPRGCELHDDYRAEVYRFFFDEFDRLAPQVKVAFCREQRTMWERFEDWFARRGQHPDDYVCNCGTTSAPATAV